MHHLFAPSSSSRWLKCPVSLALERALNLPFEGDDEDSFEETETGPNPFAAEGTTAHALAEWCLTNKKNTVDHPNGIIVDNQQRLITGEMRHHVQVYVDYIRLLIKPNTTALFEQQNTLDWIDSDLGGTADYIGTNGDVLDVADLKFGRFHRVSADNNTQLMIYALGALGKNNDTIKTVRLHICQPRINPVPSVWEVSVADLRKFEKVVKKAIAKARKYLDSGKLPLRLHAYNFGSHCGHCRVMPVCKKAAFEFDKEVKSMKIVKLERMNDKTLAERLSRGKIFERYLKALEKDAKQRLIEGKEVPGFTLEQGERREWANEKAVWAVAKKNGVRVSTLKSPPALFTELGPQKFLKTFGSLVTGKKFAKLVRA